MIAEFTDYVHLQVRNRPAGYVVIIGDSITQEAPLEPVAGQLPVNAGIGGARVGEDQALLL